jgi:hypothetical protein
MITFFYYVVVYHSMVNIIIKRNNIKIHNPQGRIHDFKLEGAHLKKLRRAEGGANIFGVFRVNFFFQF